MTPPIFTLPPNYTRVAKISPVQYTLIAGEPCISLPCTAVGALCIAVCALRIAVCALRIAVCALRIAVCALRIAVCALRIAVCALRIAVCAFRIAVTSPHRCRRPRIAVGAPRIAAGVLASLSAHNVQQKPQHAASLRMAGHISGRWFMYILSTAYAGALSIQAHGRQASIHPTGRKPDASASAGREQPCNTKGVPQHSGRMFCSACPPPPLEAFSDGGVEVNKPPIGGRAKAPGRARAARGAALRREAAWKRENGEKLSLPALYRGDPALEEDPRG
eukprot:358561-Chlamydomonas_euryale.AAC.2